MANGSVALRLVPETASSATVADQPFDERYGGPQGWVDAILSALMDMSAQAALELQSGRLSEQTRSRGGDLLGRLYVIQSKIGAREFAAAAHRAPGLDAAAVDAVIGVVDEIAVMARQTN